MNPFVRGRIPLARAAFAFVACACEPLPAPVADAAPDRVMSNVRVELGTGQLSWEELAPQGTPVELIYGPQGGYHLFGRVRFEGMGPEVYVRFRVTPIEGGAPINDPNDRLRLRPERGLIPISRGWETSNAQLVILTTIRGPGAVVGRRFRFEVTVSNVADEAVQGSASREIVVVDET